MTLTSQYHDTKVYFILTEGQPVDANESATLLMVNTEHETEHKRSPGESDIYYKLKAYPGYLTISKGIDAEVRVSYFGIICIMS